MVLVDCEIAMEQRRLVTKSRTPPRSPIPPEIDETAPDAFFDSLHSICRKCFRFQIHGPEFDDPHQTCICHEAAVCCSDGFYGYLKNLIYNEDGGQKKCCPVLPGDLVLPRMSIMTRLLNIGEKNCGKLEDLKLAEDCATVLSKVLRERSENEE